MNDFKTIGSHLAEHSKTAEFTARGAVDELFPFIYVAAKRMSVRAISKWLEETHNVKISHVTISKALNSADDYLEVLARKISAAVQKWIDYAEPCTSMGEINFIELLYDHPGILSDMLSDKPSLEYCFKTGIDVRVAIETVREEWMPLPDEFKMACLPHFTRFLNERMRN